MNSKKTRLIGFILLLFLITFARIVNIHDLPPPIHTDEALMTLSAISILEGNKNILDTFYSTTIISNIGTSIFIYLFGAEIWSLRLQSILFGSFSILFLYLFARDFLNKRSALYVAILSGLSHVFIAYSRLNLPNIQAVFLLSLSLYLAQISLRSKNVWISLYVGIVCALSLYSYTGAKIIIPVIIVFYLLFGGRERRKQYLYFVCGIIIGIIPILIYITQPTHNYFERETQVSILFNKDLYSSLGSSAEVIKAIIHNIYINIAGFFTQKDNSNQYGNTALLDPISAFLFLLFMLSTIKSSLQRKLSTSSSFIVVMFISILLLVSLTESPPLSTRLLIALPFVYLGIASQLDKISTFQKSVMFSSLLLVLISILNLKLFFYDFPHFRRAYFNWIEPNATIGLTARNENHDIYILSNPHTYAYQPIITALTYKRKQINDASLLETENILTDSKKVLIVPVVPLGSVKQENLSLVKQALANRDLQVKEYLGIPCVECEKAPMFYSIQRK